MVTDSFGNELEVGHTVRLTARRGGTSRYVDRRRTTEVLKVLPGNKLVILGADATEQVVTGNDVTLVGPDGELAIKW